MTATRRLGRSRGNRRGKQQGNGRGARRRGKIIRLLGPILFREKTARCCAGREGPYAFTKRRGATVGAEEDPQQVTYVRVPGRAPSKTRTAPIHVRSTGSRPERSALAPRSLTTSRRCSEPARCSQLQLRGGQPTKRLPTPQTRAPAGPSRASADPWTGWIRYGF